MFRHPTGHFVEEDRYPSLQLRKEVWAGSLGELELPSNCCQGRLFSCYPKIDLLVIRDPPVHTILGAPC